MSNGMNIQIHMYTIEIELISFSWEVLTPTESKNNQKRSISARRQKNGVQKHDWMPNREIGIYRKGWIATKQQGYIAGILSNSLELIKNFRVNEKVNSQSQIEYNWCKQNILSLIILGVLISSFLSFSLIWFWLKIILLLNNSAITGQVTHKNVSIINFDCNVYLCCFSVSHTWCLMWTALDANILVLNYI